MADAITEAQVLYREALDALREQREQIAEDLEFSDPSDPQQWDADEKRRRETDPGGARPCLVFDQTGQYVANVAGQIEKQPPAMHALPVDGGADRKVAEQLDGHFRHIEHASRAQQHYARAATSAGRAGVGYLIVRPEYVDRALNYQEPRISSEPDPLRVVFDPWSIELDGTDANFGYVLTPMSLREFKRQYPKSDPVSFGEEEQKRSRDDRQSVIVAESWTMRDKETNCIQFLDFRGDEVSLGEDDFWKAQHRGEVVQVISTYRETKREVWWQRMSGAEVLEKYTDRDGKELPFPADRIGIIPVYGYVGWANGRMKYCGIPRRARAAQRSYNFHTSEARAYLQTAPKSPWLTPVRAIRGFEKLWDRASVEQRAYLPYNDVDPETQQPINAPSRAPSAVNLQNHIQGADQALKDIQASIGMYQANLGAPSNETSGIAIENRKQQGEASTAHFPSHLAASIAQVGAVCLQMLPRLMDTKRRLRVMGFDGTPSTITIDPEQSQPLQETDDGLSINPNIGRYDVRVVVGAAYSTQRQQAQEAFTEMMRANPALAPAIAPLWAQVIDSPHADKLAQVLIAMAPPPVQAILSPEKNKQPGTAELTAKLQQMQQALQEAIQHANDAQQEADEAREEAQAAKEQEEINWYKAETERLKVTGANEAQIQAIVQQMVTQMLARPIEPEPGEMEQPESHEMQQFPAEMPEPMESAPMGDVAPMGEEMQ